MENTVFLRSHGILHWEWIEYKCLPISNVFQSYRTGVND